MKTVILHHVSHDVFQRFPFDNVESTKNIFAKLPIGDHCFFSTLVTVIGETFRSGGW